MNKLASGCMIACGIFFTCVSFLGFLGWSGDPSNQKWAALGCSIFGASATFALWKAKDIDSQSYLGNSDDLIKDKSVEEQQCYWKKEIRGLITAGGVGSGAFSLFLLLFAQLKPPPIYFCLAYIWLMVGWGIFRAARELAKLRH